MSKNNKLPHLTLVRRKNGWRGWSLNFTRSFERGPAVSANIERGLELTGLGSRSEFIDRAIEAFVGELEAQRRIELALNFIDLIESGNLVVIDESPLEIVRRALTGCPTRTAMEFTGELSQEYLERYGDG